MAYYDHNENISKDLYEKRFWQRKDGKEPLNVVGYGEGQPYVPPITKANTFMLWFDRYTLQMLNPWPAVLLNYWLNLALNNWDD